MLSRSSKPRPGAASSLLLALAMVSLLAGGGCNETLGQPLATAGDRFLALRVKPTFHGGSYAAQALVTPYTKASVAHLVVALFTVADGVESPAAGSDGAPLAADLQLADPAAEARFEKLASQATYRVRGYAYRAAGTDPADKISVDDASFVEIGPGSLGQHVTLPILLADRPFAALASGAIDLQDGQYDPAGVEAASAPLPRGYVVTIAGSPYVSAQRDGFGLRAAFVGPGAQTSNVPIVTDDSGNVYVADITSLRKVDRDFRVTTIAGGSAFGHQDGKGAAAQFQPIRGIAVAPDGTLYVSEYYIEFGRRRDCYIRKITPEGEVATIAGSSTCQAADGVGETAGFLRPGPIEVNTDGSLLIGDDTAIRTLTPDGSSSTRVTGLKNIEDLVLDGAGGAYVVESQGDVLRVDLETGAVSSIMASDISGNPVPVKVVNGSAICAWPGKGFAIGSRFEHNVLVWSGDPEDRLGLLYPGKQAAPSGTVDGAIGTAQFKSPGGLASGPDGTLYVMDAATLRVVYP